MLQSDERLSERLTVYVYPSVKSRIDREVEVSPWDLPGLAAILHRRNSYPAGVGKSAGGGYVG